MKNLSKQAAALMLSGALTFVHVAAIATPNNNEGLVKVEKTASLVHELNAVSNSMKVILGVMLDENQKVRLEIFDNKDVLVHQYIYKDSKGFIQLFDLKELGKGEYLFRITAGNTSYIDKVQVGEKEKVNEPFQAYFSGVDNDKIKFSYADAKGEVLIKVKDEGGKIIFSESLGKEFSSSGIANLSKLKSGNYQVELSNGLQTQSKAIELTN